MPIFNRNLNEGESVRLILDVEKTRESYFVTISGHKSDGSIQQLQTGIDMRFGPYKFDPRTETESAINTALTLGGLNPSEIEPFIR